MAKTITVKIDENAFNGLNNAIIAYNEIIFAIDFCCDIPSKLEPLKKLSEEELHARRDALVKMYRDMEQSFLN
jgi:hypothetical protein